MSDAQKYTIGWICAIPIEYLAAQLFLDEEHDSLESMSTNDNNHYTLGKMGKHNVVIAVLPYGEYGTSSAAGVAKDMLHSFPNVRIGLMVGIGGGAPSADHDIRLGDVVISAPSNGRAAVFQYDFGKAIQGQEFMETRLLNQPPTIVQSAMTGLLTRYERKGHQLDVRIADALIKNPRLKKKFQRPEPSTDRLYQPTQVHPEDDQSSCAIVCGDDPPVLVVRPDRTEYDNDPAIHYGTIASANTLMKDASTRDALAAKKGVLCFEMEAAGLMNHFPCVVIRGICDYSDSHKNKEWQPFAAIMAAAYARDLLNQITPNKVETERAIGEALGSIQKTLNETKSVASERRHAGTGTWFLESVEFKEWKLGSRRHLWLKGLAGCGKTVLSTTILDSLHKQNSSTVLSFFFDFNDPGKQTLDGLLRSLAFQLYHLGGEAAKELNSRFRSHDDGRTQPSESVLSACVESMIQVTKEVIVILDALDECTARRKLLDWMGSFASGDSQFIVTGRPEAEFLREIPSLFEERNCILLDKNAVNADIRSYVTAILKQDKRFVSKELSQHLQEQIRDKVGDGADGMFRWAACQLDSLANCWSSRAIKKALQTLPHDLDETYERMLQAIPSDRRSDADRLLQFLIHAKRPLTLSESREVIATDADQHPRGFDVEARPSPPAAVLHYCPGLVFIVEVEKYDGTTVEELHLTHFSVKEYLLKLDNFQLKTASTALVKTCLTYLTDINETPRGIKNEFPMARYAAEVWTSYAVLKTSEDIVWMALRFLQEETTFQRWTRLYQADWAWDHDPGPPRASRLYYASLGGLADVAKGLITEGADINAQGDHYGNALQAASYEGHREVVQLLLDKGADIKAQGGDYGNALQAASSQGHREVVQLLLDKGVDINAQGGHFGNALQGASWRGHREAVQLLLERGADVNAQGGHYGNALQAASSWGHQEVVQLLLERGADINAQGGEYGNALQAASSQGYQEVVQLLLDKGADIKAQGGHFGNALQGASWRGDQEVMQLLLERGADVNAQGGHYGNALQAASCGGRREVVQLLLDKGADINAQGGHFGNALQAASSEGHREVVQLLLDKGADINAQGGEYGNALQVAP